MALAGTIITGIVLVLGSLNGFRRGAVKEGMVLAAALLGVVLVMLWGERGGAMLARRMSWQPGTGQWLAAMTLLWGTVLGTGYAAAALLPRRVGKLSLLMRGAGAVLGLLNAGMLVAWSLRYTQHMFYGDPAGRKPTWIRAGAASRFLLEYLDLMLLGLAWSVAVISLVVIVAQLIMRLISPDRVATRASVRPTPRVTPSLSDPQPTSRESTSAPIAPGMERSFLEKPRPTAGGDRSTRF